MIKPTGIVPHHGKSNDAWCNRAIFYIIGNMKFLSWEVRGKLSQRVVLQ